MNLVEGCKNKPLKIDWIRGSAQTHKKIDYILMLDTALQLDTVWKVKAFEIGGFRKKLWIF